MSITYSDKSFLKLLLHWRGSIWKIVWRELLIFLALYFLINLTYRFGLNEDQQLSFEKLVITFERWNSLIPLTFLLGFYVNHVVSRWWEQLNYIAWPDKLLVFITANISGNDPDSRLIRRTFARYSNLLSTLVWKEVSLKIKKRFPTDRHVVDAGLMTEEEWELYQNTTPDMGRWFVPVSWMITLLVKCKDEGRITDYAFQKTLDELYSYRATSAMLTLYDWINIPLAYTQVATVATYGYFSFCLVSRQALRNESQVMRKDEIDIYFPIFTVLEFLFYLGWLKVGELLRVPFGEDDEDFAMNYVLDRNVLVGNMLVDELNRQQPPLQSHPRWEGPKPELPHTKASHRIKDAIPNWRLGSMKFNEDDMKYEYNGQPLPKTVAVANYNRALPPIIGVMEEEEKTRLRNV